MERPVREVDHLRGGAAQGSAAQQEVAQDRGGAALARGVGGRGQGALEQRERDGLVPLGAAREHACVGEALEEFGLVLGVGFDAVEASHAALAVAVGEDHLERGVVRALRCGGRYPRRARWRAQDVGGEARRGGRLAHGAGQLPGADSRRVWASCRRPKRTAWRSSVSRSPRARSLRARAAVTASCSSARKGGSPGAARPPAPDGRPVPTSFSPRVRFSPRKVTRP